jgi:hypothetical protein
MTTRTDALADPIRAFTDPENSFGTSGPGAGGDV